MRKRERRGKPTSSHFPPPATLSLCLIVRNEARNISDCINPLRSVVEEIVVVDTGSTDDTKTIATGLGAKVFDFPWRDDFSAARNESIRHASGDYILWLDADDRMDPGEIRKLERLRGRLTPAKDEAYFFLIRNLSQVDGETQFQQLRIFPKIEGVYFEGPIHEQIFPRLKLLGVRMVETDIEILHQGYQTPEEVLRKSLRNLRMIQTALDRDPENVFLHYQAARTLAGLNRFKEAIGHMAKVVQHPEVRQNERRFCFEATLLLAQWEMEMGDYGEANRLLEEAAALGEGSPLLHFYKGDLFFRMREYPKAIDEMSAFLRVPQRVGTIPVSLDWLTHYPYFVLWLSYRRLGGMAQAEEKLHALFSQPRTHPKCLEEMGNRCLQEGLFLEAAQFYRKVIEEGGTGETTFSNLGLALWKAGVPEEAEKAYEKALALNPQRLESLTNLGHLYHRRKDYEKAIGCFLRALELDPNLLDVRLALGEIYFCLYDPDRLVEQCDQLLKFLCLPRNFVIESLKDVSLLYQTIGEALLEKGQIQNALKAHALSFLMSPSREGMERLFELGKSHGQLKTVLEQIEEALAIHGAPSGLLEAKRGI
ncbi:MAG: tetratricopeptide repeat protein [Desulfobacterota bacterium]|nr:tetratricopeptide repeat protein [Thermodesulfobacteriota bacterium]